jgi:general stress protein 26
MNDIQRLSDMIKDIKFTMMTTVDENGAIYSRPMATQQIDESSFDGRLWFFTRKNSFKVHNIEHDQHVNLAYANPDHQKYVSVAGRAILSEDRELMEKLWNPMYKAWFPEGLEDPQILLIGVQVESADLWDTPPSKVVQLAGFIKATVTGQPYKVKGSVEHMEWSDKQIH